jgi:hypothetical protein
LETAATDVDAAPAIIDSEVWRFDTAAIDAAVVSDWVDTVIDCVPSVVDRVEPEVETALARFETFRIESEFPEISVLRLDTLSDVEFEKKLNDSEIWLSDVDASDRVITPAVADVAPMKDPILPGSRADAPNA